MNGTVATVRFSTLAEAMVVRGLLHARGCEVWLPDRHLAAADGLMIPALGSVRLCFLTSQAEQVREAISEAVAGHVSNGTAEAKPLNVPLRAALTVLMWLGIPFLIAGGWGLTWTLSHYANNGIHLPGWMVFTPRSLSNALGAFSAPESSLVDLATPGMTMLTLIAMLMLVLIDAWKPLTGREWSWHETDRPHRMFDL